MIKNVLSSLRQRAGPQRICSRQKSIRSGTARDSFSQTPHMRGKVVMFIAIRTAQRITPACAGKKQQSALGDFSGKGSPPHMRGKENVQRNMLDGVGITPAYAGKRLAATSKPSPAQDHPRMCGEKPDRILWEHWKEGSPPRMRGKVANGAWDLGTQSITPACAGKRSAASCCGRTMRDHPHVCGEKFNFFHYASIKSGITPACAGKRALSEKQALTRKDHPRMCGEKCLASSSILVVQGSPPRMRGKVTLQDVQRFAVRITPAYAGKSGKVLLK